MVEENSELTYQPNINEVIKRYRNWFNPEGKTRYLVNIIPEFWNSFNWDLSIDVPSPKPLEDYNFENDAEIYEYLDYRLSLIQKYWEKKLEWSIKDDMIPTIKPKLGWAEIAGAISGGHITYYSQTSNLDQIIHNYESFDFESIKFSKQTTWSQILIKGTKHLLEKAKGKFIVQPRMNLNPSDLARAYRGKDLFTDFYDNPEYVHKLLQKCTEAIIKYNEYMVGLVGQFKDGLPCTWNGGYWVPGKMIPHMGDNVSDLVSPDTFREFILPYINQVTEYFGGCIFGRDASSEQLWSEIKKIEKIKAFKPRNMGNYIIDEKVLERIIKKTEGIPLFLEARNRNEFLKFKHVVSKNGVKVFFTVHCRGQEEAKEVVDVVRGM